MVEGTQEEGGRSHPQSARPVVRAHALHAALLRHVGQAVERARGDGVGHDEVLAQQETAEVDCVTKHQAISRENPTRGASPK